MHNRKHATKEKCLLILITVHSWGWGSNLTYVNLLRIARATLIQIAYEHGYHQLFLHYEVMTWDRDIAAIINKGEKLITNYLSCKQGGGSSVVEEIDLKHRGYLHSLHYYVIQTVELKVSFTTTFIAMNTHSCIDSESIPSLTIIHNILNA